MSESNGQNGQSDHLPIPPISPDVQRLLDKGREGRIADNEISDEIEAVVKTLLNAFPGQEDRIANRLEGYASKMRSDIEAQKRKDRNGGNRSGR